MSPFVQLGATRRKTYGTKDFGIYGFRGGLNIKDVPEDLDDSELSISVNGYLQTAGGWRMRNGITKRGTPPTGAIGPILSGARFWQSVKNGSAVTPPTLKLLAQIGNTLYDYDNNVNIGSIGSLSSPLPATYVRAADPNDPNTGYTGGQNDVTVICTGSGGPYIYDGTNLYTPAGWSAAAGAQWCALVNGVVFFGGIGSNPRIIYGTGDGTSASFESLPGYNTFEMSYPVTGLCARAVNDVASLFIGQSTGASVLYGTGPSNYVLEDVPSFGDGVMSGYSLNSYQGTIFFLGRMAEYAYGDGAPTPISTKVEPWILNDATVPGYPMSQNRQLSYSFIYNNRLHVGYCSNSTVPNVFLSYSLQLQAWDGVLVTTPPLGCAVALDAPTDASPTQMVMGSSNSPQMYNWDVLPSPTGSAATDAGTAFLAQMRTKFFKFGVPGTLKSLLRVYPEMYILGGFNGSVTATSDYGNSQSNYTLPLSTQPAITYWNQFNWNQANWGGSGIFVAYVAPQSRVDTDELQFESCALGILTYGNCAPWIIGGFSGMYRQLGRA